MGEGGSPAFAEKCRGTGRGAGCPLPALVSRDDVMAEMIASFALLLNAEQQAVLVKVQKALGAAQAEQVRGKLAAATPSARKAKKASDRRL